MYFYDALKFYSFAYISTNKNTNIWYSYNVLLINSSFTHTEKKSVTTNIHLRSEVHIRDKEKILFYTLYDNSLIHTNYFFDKYIIIIFGFSLITKKLPYKVSPFKH